MAQTFARICIVDYLITDDDGSTFTVQRGQEYLTSRERDGQVRVFSTYWVWVPVTIFAGAQEFWPTARAAANGTAS